MDLDLLLSLVGATAVAAVALGTTAWMGRRVPIRWRIRDAVYVFLVLIWGSLFGGMIAVRLSTGTWTPSGDIPILASLAGTSAGGLLSTACVLLRADWERLGLRTRADRRWWLLVPILSLSFVALSTGWSLVLEQMGHSSEQQIATELFLHWPSVEGGLIVLYAVFVAPLVEELLFRGFFLPPLIERLGAWGGIVVTAVLFGLMHLSDPLVVPPLVLLGVALGWLRHRSGSVWTSLALHMLNNGLAVASVLLLE